MAKNIEELTKLATDLRNKFEEYETRACNRPWTNVELAAAFNADVGKLTKLIMIKEGLLKDADFSNQQLEHELADCLWCILVFAKKYNIDLEQAMLEMAEKTKKKFNKRRMICNYF